MFRFLGSMGGRANVRLSACPVFAWANTGAFVKKRFTPGWRVNAENIVQLDTRATLRIDARKCGRANRKERMARPRYQDGSLFIRGKRIKVWAARWREDVIREDGTLYRTQPTVVLGALSELSRREARSLLQRRVSEINQGRHRARPMSPQSNARFWSHHRSNSCWPGFQNHAVRLSLPPS
jgi:hypothetical protein